VPTAIIGGIYTVNYYDNYNVDLPNGLGASITTSFGLSSTSNTNGLPTVSKVRVLETNHWISTVTYYDAKARPIYVYSENSYLQTVDILESLFDFRGNVIETKTTHRKVGQNAIEIYDTFTYDHMQRIKTHKQRIGDHTEVIAENRYDELGRLEQKSVGGNETVTNRLQNIDYSYNVRGWLKDVNDPKKLNATNDLFGFAIDYNRSDEGVTAKSLFNGNISGVYWKTDNNSSTYKGYEYTYDALNRFERAKFSENKNYKSMYDVSVYNYDRNGNIKRLVRKMPNSTNTRFGTTMDNLKYTYNGNQLLAVKDYISNANGLEGFNDGNTTGNDYLYDANGNMVVDKNKNITEITYNHLNLPETVSINDGGVQVGTISYTYDATGEKLEKTVSTGTTTSYAGNYIYENNSLKYFNHPEGYVETNGNNFEYVYQYKDHLGNIRLSYKDTDGNGSISGNSSSVFYDGINANSSGWNSRGAKYGSTAHPSTAHVLSGESSIVLRKTSKGDVYAHSNTWIPIRNSEPTEYIFSGWIYAESTGSSYQSSARLVFFMNKETETDYATQVEHSDVVTTKNKWVYIEKRVFVPPLIDKINLRVGMYNGGAFTTNVWFDNLSIRKVDHIQDIEIIEENNYYPFGLKHKGYNNTVTSTNIALRYKFGGKELNDELGLDWYDVSARNYDPAIARWMNIDPLAELMRRHSPYNYAFNNPIIFQDPDGMAPLTELFDTKGNKIGEDENGNDGNVSIVSNNEDVKRIKKNTKKGKLATKKDVESGLQTTKTVLKEALNVLQRTIDNGGKTEEGSIVDASGNVTEQKNTGVEIVDGKEVRTLEFDQTKSRKEEGDVSIHSHPTEAEVSGGNVKSFDAKSPSASHDLKNIFPNYNQNVIVGRLGITTASQSGSGGVILHKPDNGVVFFDKVGNINLSLKSKAAQKILK
jgi:RHS repeat-associated protein